jgi:hypothetical protein
VTDVTFGGLPTRWEPEGTSRGLGLVLPGRAYSPAAPLLDLSRRALLQHGFTVREVWWDTTRRGEEDAVTWVRRHAEEALAEEQADHVVVVAKSLGTHAAPYAAERGLDAVWLTPLLVEPVIAEGIAANAGRQLLVGGSADHLWDSAVARELADNGCELLEVQGADHSMATPDVVRTMEVHVEVARAMSGFLSQL